MNDEDELLGFVKGKLEEGEGISSMSLSRILAAAEENAPRAGHVWGNVMFTPSRALLAAASLAVAVCGWHFFSDSSGACRDADVSNVIALLVAADGDDLDSGSSLSDALCTWQDAPVLAAD